MKKDTVDESINKGENPDFTGLMQFLQMLNVLPQPHQTKRKSIIMACML